jgi:Transposase IS66 family/Transposase, Mutator family
VDGYAPFSSLVEAHKDASIKLAFCWAHARRPFYEFYISTQSPLAAEVLARIAKLYEIEAGIRGQPPDARQGVRQLRSRPLVEDLHLWLQDLWMAVRIRVNPATTEILAWDLPCSAGHSWTSFDQMRKSFIRKCRLKCRAVADSLEEAGERLFIFSRLPDSQWRSARTTNAIERLHEEFKRRIKTQTVCRRRRRRRCCSGHS